MTPPRHLPVDEHQPPGFGGDTQFLNELGQLIGRAPHVEENKA